MVLGSPPAYAPVAASPSKAVQGDGWKDVNCIRPVGLDTCSGGAVHDGVGIRQGRHGRSIHRTQVSEVGKVSKEMSLTSRVSVMNAM